MTTVFKKKKLDRIKLVVKVDILGMAKIAWVAKSKKKPKFSSRIIRRCFRCGRRRGFMRDFDVCRICFRELASRGEIPGIKKSSW